MNYHSYQHIQKYGTPETEGILSGTCWLSCKIDGTNGAVWLGDGGAVRCGSRTRELAPEEGRDNSGFCAAVLKSGLFEPVLAEHPNWIVYGEWLVPHLVRTYGADAWRHFYVFDVVEVIKDGPSDENGNWLAERRYVPADEYIPYLEGHGIRCIPVLAKLENPTEDQVKEWLGKSGSFLVEGGGAGEGIVLKNYGYRNRFGHQVWAKWLTSDYSSRKISERSERHALKEGGGRTEAHIVSKWLTPEAVAKEFLKYREGLGSVPYSSGMFGDFLRVLWKEWIGDNIVLILSELGTPTIDFRLLRTLVCREAAAQLAGAKDAGGKDAG